MELESLRQQIAAKESELQLRKQRGLRELVCAGIVVQENIKRKAVCERVRKLRSMQQSLWAIKSAILLQRTEPNWQKRRFL